MQGLEKQTGVVDIDTAVEEWGWGGGVLGSGAECG